MRKRLIKIMSTIFAVTLSFSAGLTCLNTFNKKTASEGASAATTKQNVSGIETPEYADDIEWRVINDKVNTASVSDDWTSTGITSIQTPDVARYHFTNGDHLVTYYPYEAGSGDLDYAIVVEFDMVLNNVEGGLFGFIYGADKSGNANEPLLHMEAGKANCLSFFGVDSMFYGTLDTRSLIYQGHTDAVGTHTIGNRWLDWKRSAKTTLYIHPDGSQEMYQDGELTAYVTAKDIAQMDADYAVYAASKGYDYTPGTIIARSKDLDGYLGFAFRSADDVSAEMDVTFKSLRIGYVAERWFTGDASDYNTHPVRKTYQTGPNGEEHLAINGNVFPGDPMINTAGNLPASIWWRVEDLAAPASLAADGSRAMGLLADGNTCFEFKNSTGATVTGDRLAAGTIGWIKAVADDYYYEAEGATALTTKLELPNVDARLGENRYVMLRMKLWLGGLDTGMFSVSFGNIHVTIELLTIGMVTAYYLRVYDGEIFNENDLLPTQGGLTFEKLTIYDNATFAVALRGNSCVSVSYGPEDNAGEYFYESVRGSGMSQGNMSIETTAENMHCYYDDIELFTFEPYLGEDFTNGNYDSDRITVQGDGAKIDAEQGLVHMTTSSTQENAVLLSPDQYTNFTLEFDSPQRGTGWLETDHMASWMGIVFGMDTTTDKYHASNVLFLYVNAWGGVYFAKGTQQTSIGEEYSLIKDEELSTANNTVTRMQSSMICPVDADNDGVWPTALPFHPESINTTTQFGCANTNIHFKIVVQDGMVYMYQQIDGYEMVKVFESIPLTTADTTGYVKICSTTNADFKIDNVKLTANNSNTIKAINTFLDADGTLWAATESTMSKTTDEEDWVLASEIFPKNYPVKANYTFIGWADSISNSIVGADQRIANFGSRTMYPVYVRAYQNSITTTGEITMNYYLEYSSNLVGTDNRIVVEVNEYNADGSLKNNQVLVSTDKLEGYVTQTDGATTYRFQYPQAPKDYMNRIEFRVRVGGVNYYDPVNKNGDTPWTNYSLSTYITKLKEFARDSLTGETKDIYNNYAVHMEIFCDAARQYFDDSVTEITAQNGVDQDTFDAVQAYTSDMFPTDVRVATWGSKPEGLRLMGFTSVFEMGTKVRLNFQIYDDHDYRFAYSDEIGTTWETDGDSLVDAYPVHKRYNEKGDVYYYIEFSSVSAKDLDKPVYVMVVVDNHDTALLIRVSPLGYAHMAIRTAESAGAKATVEQKKLAAFCKTLYQYQITTAAWAAL